MNTKEFTFEQAFSIQTENITMWSQVLNPKAYSLLLGRLIEMNASEDVKSPYDVPRGQIIDHIVQEIARKLCLEAM